MFQATSSEVGLESLSGKQALTIRFSMQKLMLSVYRGLRSLLIEARILILPKWLLSLCQVLLLFHRLGRFVVRGLRSEILAETSLLLGLPSTTSPLFTILRSNLRCSCLSLSEASDRLLSSPSLRHAV